MATAAETQLVLGTACTGAKIVLEENRTNSGSTVLTKGYYCRGGVDAPGRACWVDITVADADTVQAAAVLAGLRA